MGSMAITPAPERFEAFVLRTDTCWLWQGYIEAVGYGRFYLTRGTMEWAHRAAYRFYVGPIPTGLFVCHTCDVRACVNPAHLFLGTNQDNMLDAKAKGRTTAGEKNPQAKLTREAVADIRASYRPGVVLQRHLAERYGVSRRAIGQVLSGEHWA